MIARPGGLAAAAPSISLLVQDHAQLAPLACGDVMVDGITLTLARDVPAKTQDRSGNDPAVHASELSLARHLVRLGAGDRSWVAIPVFPLRHFMHRTFFVRAGGIRDLTDLRGARIGLRDWPATGSAWTRATLRLAGVAPEELRWWVGPVEAHHAAPLGPPVGGLPTNVTGLTAGQTLFEMLRQGDLDMVVSAEPPQEPQPAGNPIVRAFPDYRRVERTFYERYRIYPAQHVIAVRRPLFERYPWILRSLYDALERSQRIWRERVRTFHCATPWLLAEIEDSSRLMGEDWQPNGLEPNRGMLEMLIGTLAVDGLLRDALTADDVFPEFQP